MLARRRRIGRDVVIPGDESRMARVAAVLARGATIADRTHPDGIRARAGLAKSSGLSREGIELALGEYLETNATDAELESLLAWAKPAPRCHVVLASNVCIGALRCIALAVATSEIVFVRPSRRDPVLAEIVVNALAQNDDFVRAHGSIEIVTEVNARPGDHVHAYGRDETMDAIASALPSGTLLRRNGSGIGIATLAAQSSLTTDAESLARDVVVFDQQGCLSPRFVLVEGSAERALEAGRCLHEALSVWDRTVPRGAIDRVTAGNLALYRTTFDAIGASYATDNHVVGVDTTPRSLMLPPAARALHVVAVPSLEQLTALLAPWTATITVVGSNDDGSLSQSVRRLAPRARRAKLGSMQKPPLDGPVDRRELPW